MTYSLDLLENLYVIRITLERGGNDLFTLSIMDVGPRVCTVHTEYCNSRAERGCGIHWGRQD